MKETSNEEAKGNENGDSGGRMERESPGPDSNMLLSLDGSYKPKLDLDRSYKIPKRVLKGDRNVNTCTKMNENGESIKQYYA